MSEHDEFLTAFCQAVNAVKRITLTPDALKLDQYLGGDLGIDSVEMLEIWFRIEKALALQIPDSGKRDIYSVGEVIDVIECFAPTKSA
jgi:acyl carrier protein